MKKPTLTQHAKSRMQQRGVSELQVRLIQEFGQYHYQKGGAHLAYIPEKILFDLRKAIDTLQGIAVIVGESDVVVTALHHTRRVRRTQYSA